MARRPIRRTLHLRSLADGGPPATAQRTSTARSTEMRTSRMHAAMAAIGLGLVVTMGAAGSGRVLAKESSGPAPMTAAQTGAVMAAVVDALETDGALTPYLT